MSWALGVVVPAHNEAAHVEACLRSISVALSHTRLPRHRSHVVLVADACVDGTAALARQVLAGWGEVVEVEAASPGAARAAGTDAVLRFLAGTPSRRTWLASTDADTVVPPDWLRRHLDCARSGVAAAAGVVRVDSFAGLPASVAEQFTKIYEGAPDEDHPHVHAANFGVRADAYLAIGGWRAVAKGEEHHLWDAVRDRGWPTMSPRTLDVTTSSRTTSRVRGGFADWLLELAALEPS